MSIAAVPNYLQEQNLEFYLSAPPGHRFLLYFAAWGENQETGKVDWRMKDRVPKMKRRQGQLVQDGWEDVTNDQYACTIAACRTPSYEDERPRKRRPKTDTGLKPWKPMMEALASRQAVAMAQIGDDALLRLDALATAPFTTGLGNEHPLENGFAFLNPYGLPYLPGSGVKGVLRQAALELASGDWDDPKGWDEAAITNLFGRESGNGDTDHLRGALVFWDVIPQIEGDNLMVEIMTPHQGHYYQWKKDQRGNLIEVAPHESGQPNPISFLTVPPGSGFAFHVQCNLAHLNRLAPELARKGRWKTLLEAAFKHAFGWLGFGAKTAVGYGAMTEDTEAKRRREKEAADQAAQQAEASRRAAMSPNQITIEKFRKACDKRAQELRGAKEKQNTGIHQLAQKLAKDARENPEWTQEEKLSVAEAIAEWLPQIVERMDKDALKKLKLSELRGQLV